MMTFMIAEIFLKAAILSLLLYLFAKNEADYSFQKVAMVTAGIALGSFLIAAFVPEGLEILLRGLIPGEALKAMGFGIGFALIMAFVMSMIMAFCWLTWKKALGVTIPFLVICIGFAWAKEVVERKIHGDNQAERAAVLQETHRELQEAMEFQKESFALMEPVGAPSSDGLQRTPPEPQNSEQPSDSVDVKEERAVDVRPEDAEPIVSDSPAFDAPPSAVAKSPLPADSTTQVESVDWDGARKQIKIQGIIKSSNGEPMVIVNRQTLTLNETISLRHKGYEYVWKLERVEKNQASWIPISAKALE